MVLNMKYTLRFALCVVALLTFATHVVANDLPDFVELVKENSKTVVNISTKKVVNRAQGNTQGVPEELLRFFGIPPQNSPDGSTDIPDAPISEAFSLGTGFVIDAEGYVITNYHVIREADEIFVRLYDRREVQAKLVGFDERTDIALLRVEADDLHVVQIGSSKDLQVGEWVLAIGEPFGLEYTATKGIVSAKHRSLPSDPYVSFIQTDVPINPGNSGGPLFNLDGEVVGINAQIYSRSGGYMGLSFAIPIENAMHVVQQLRSTGEVIRGMLGVQIQEVSYALAQSLDMEKPRGALIARVFENSAASKAGLQEGDVIIKFDDTNINNASDLPPVVGMTNIGKRVPIRIIRQGNEKTIYATIKGDNAVDQVAHSGAQSNTIQKLGMQVRTLNKQEQKDLGLTGVVITKIVNKDLYNRGIRKGDIITSVNHKRVTSVQTLEQIVQPIPAGRRVPVRIVRNNSSTFVPIQIQ